MIAPGWLFRGLPVALVASIGTFLQAAGPIERQAADAERGAGAGRLEQSFHQPPGEARPWAYWWWLNANVTEESIRRDLEGLSQKGVGGVLLFDVTEYGHHLVPPPPRRVPFMSPPWRRLVRYAMSEANRLGLEMSVNLSTCGGALRAPWKTGDDAPKCLLWTSTSVVGPTQLTCLPPDEQGPPSWDVAVLAVQTEPQRDVEQTRSPAKENETIRFSNDPQAAKPVVRKTENAVAAARVIDLTGKADAQGRIPWDVPAGRWQILRFFYTLVEGAESDVDMLDAKAVEAHFDRFGRAVLADAGPMAGQTLTHFYSVSWEGSTPTWTHGFGREFEKHRGYRLRRYLPALTGMTVDGPEISQRFLRDYSRTLSDCFMNNCYGTLDRLCEEAGVKWHSESGGPWRRDTLMFEHADSLAFWGRNDVPQGEFWWPGTTEIGRSNGRHAAMAAHVYGRPSVSIEAFTHMK
ncbi:MAG: glycosyl hydrolase, partial [Planctomycetota bacterium]